MDSKKFDDQQEQNGIPNNAVEGEIIERETKDTEAKVISDVLSEDLMDLKERDGRFAKFFERFENALSEAGISKRKFYSLLGCSGIFIVSLIVFIYLLSKIFLGQDMSIKDKAPTQIENPPEVIMLPKPDSLFFERGLFLGYQLGRREISLFKNFGQSLEIGLILAQPIKSIFEDEITKTVALLKEIDQIMNRKIQKELDDFPNREEKLMGYLNELKQLNEEAKTLRSGIVAQMTDLQTKFELVSSEKQNKEALFFDNLKVYLAKPTSDALVKFIDFAKAQSELKALFKARSKLKFILDENIKRMDARIKGIELNREALITGIRIVPIEGSGLDLVEPLKK